MTTLTWLAVTGWAAFLILAALFVILGCDYRARCEQVRGLRDQLRAESDCAAHWFKIARGLPVKHATPDWLPERPTLTQGEHIADAIERVEYGPVEAARRGMSLPGAEVVPLRPKGGAS